jgi:hypothetical protein
MNANAVGYESEIDQFFKYLKKGDVENAVTSIYKTNKYVSSIPDQVIAVKNQLNALPGLVGELNLLKKLDTYNVNDQFVHVTYLATYDRQPVRFEFQFFKVNSGWRIYSFSFDDNIDDDIEAIARKRALNVQK